MPFKPSLLHRNIHTICCTTCNCRWRGAADAGPVGGRLGGLRAAGQAAGRAAGKAGREVPGELLRLQAALRGLLSQQCCLCWCMGIAICVSVCVHMSSGTGCCAMVWSGVMCCAVHLPAAAPPMLTCSWFFCLPSGCSRLHDVADWLQVFSEWLDRNRPFDAMIIGPAHVPKFACLCVC